MSLTTNAVSFVFDGLPIHKKLIVRARVQTTCTVAQNQTVMMTLSGATKNIITKILTVNE